MRITKVILSLLLGTLLVSAFACSQEPESNTHADTSPHHRLQ